MRNTALLAFLLAASSAFAFDDKPANPVVNTAAANYANIRQINLFDECSGATAAGVIGGDLSVAGTLNTDYRWVDSSGLGGCAIQRLSTSGDITGPTNSTGAQVQYDDGTIIMVVRVTTTGDYIWSTGAILGGGSGVANSYIRVTTGGDYFTHRDSDDTYNGTDSATGVTAGEWAVFVFTWDKDAYMRMTYVDPVKGQVYHERPTAPDRGIGINNGVAMRVGGAYDAADIAGDNSVAFFEWLTVGLDSNGVQAYLDDPFRDLMADPGYRFVSSNGTADWALCTGPSVTCSLDTAIANATAGTTVYLSTATGNYVLDGEKTFAADGTAIAPITWEPFTAAAGDWDGTPGQVVLYREGGNRVNVTGDHHVFRGIKVEGTDATHHRAWQIDGTANIFYRCIAKGVGSGGFIFEGDHNIAIQCEADGVGGPLGGTGFRSAGNDNLVAGCYAHDGQGAAFAEVYGWQDGATFTDCIAANYATSENCGSNALCGYGFVVGDEAVQDPCLEDGRTQSQWAKIQNCTAYACSTGFAAESYSALSAVPGTLGPRPLWLQNCVAVGCARAVANRHSEPTALMLSGLGLQGNTAGVVMDGFTVIHQLVANTNLSASAVAAFASGDYRVRGTTTGWPNQYVSGGALTGWSTYPQLGAAPVRGGSNEGLRGDRR